MSAYLNSLELTGNLNVNASATTSFTITAAKSTKKGIIDVTFILNADNAGLLAETFRFLKREFNAKTPSYSRIFIAKAAFDSLQECPDAFNILSKPACNINADQFRLALSQFETYLINATASEHTRYSYSSAVRRHLANTNLELQEGRHIWEELKQFKSRFTQPRKDFKSHVVLGDISTIEYFDIASLESQAIENIRSSLDAIEQVCQTIIDDYLKVTSEHKELEKHLLKPEFAEYYTYRLKQSEPWDNRYLKQPQGSTEQDLLAFIIQSASNFILDSKTKLPGLSQLPTVLKGKTIWKDGSSYYSFFFAGYFLPNHVLIAIAVLICQKTGWNPGSVHALSKSDIEQLSSTRYLLQSLKSKTDDKTPVYELRKSSEPLLFRAVELLLWHHKQVITTFELEESRLFIGIYRKKFDVFLPLHKTNLYNNFIGPYDLKDFSAKDLRASRAGLTMLTTRDFEAVRELLGHNSITTTSGYLYNTLFFQLNEARILEFQRRIEATISFIDRGEELVTLRKFKMRHVDINIIAPEHVGDGTRCLDPFNSPDPRVRKGDRCDGLYCHVNGGCRNNIIQVSSEDVELAQRTRKYYQSRWLNLYEKNPKAFAQIHIPKIIFIHVFLAHIKQVRPSLMNLHYA